MPQHKPTETDDNELAAIAKAVTTKVIWRLEPQGWRLKVKVAALEREEVFDLTAYRGRTSYSFTLLYHNYVIRKFTKHGPHEIGGVVFTQPHKHIWDGETENRKAYIPPDINQADDVNEQFLAFCRECHIEILGEYQSVAF